MAQSPYSGVPQEQAQLEAPDDIQHIEVGPNAFGAAIGEGLQKAGAGFSQAADFYSKVAADDATNNFLTGSRAIMYGDPSKGPALGPDGQPVKTPDGGAVYEGGFYGLHGRNAMDAYPQAQEQLNELLTEQRATLHTAASRLQFDTENRRYLNQALGEMGVHANQQQFEYAKEVNTTAATVGLNAVSRVANNDIASAQAGDAVINAYVKNAEIQGMPRDGAELKARQEIALTRIRALVGSPNAGDRAMADKILTDSAGLLGSLANYDEIVGRVKQANYDAVSVTETDKLVDQTMADMGAQAKAGGGFGSAGAPVPAPTGPVYDQIGRAAAVHGATPAETNFLQREAYVESRGNPAAINGQSKGLFQFHDQTFASLGGGNIHDVGDQTSAALRGTRQNATLLNEAGVPVTDGNLYLMHQQGPAGGRALLTAPPDTNAVQALAPAYGGNTAIATRAIVRNGGTPDMTAGQFTSMWQSKFGGGSIGAGQGAATSSVADQLRMNMPQLLDRAQAKAEELFPNYPDQQQRFVQNYERRINQTISQQDQQYLADTHLVMQAAEGATSFADIEARGPQAASALHRMAIENPLAYNSLEHRFDVESRGRAESFGTGFSGYLSRALAPTTDPNRITNPMQLNPFLGAGKDAALTTAGQRALGEITDLRGNPKGEAFVTQARTILGQMHGDLTFSSQPAGRYDEKGEKAFSAFSAEALPVLVSSYKNGTLNQVLDPKSPDYIGKMAERYMRTPAEIIKDRLDMNETDRMALGIEKGQSYLDNATLGRNFLKSQVSKGRLSQQEAIRIGEDYGWFSRPAGAPQAAGHPAGWKPGQPPPISALPPLGA